MPAPAAAEILWIAVDPSRRGRGLGTVLLDRVLDDLAADGASVIVAKTLDRSAGYPPYEATRAFWEHRGFVHVDTIDPLPGWQPGNPAAIYIAALRATRRPAPRTTSSACARPTIARSPTTQITAVSRAA